MEGNVVLGPTVGTPHDGVTSDRSMAGADVARCEHQVLWITNFAGCLGFRCPRAILSPFVSFSFLFFFHQTIPK